MDLILTLTGGLTAALVFGFGAQRLKLSPIVGYLAAGIVVGPFTPGFVAHPELANELAEIGIILLMFGVGLSFHVKELLAVRNVALPGALSAITAVTLFGALVGRCFDWSLGTCVVFGLSISVASTVVLLRVLADQDATQTRLGHIAVGWLVVEDFITVIVLVLIPVLGGGEAVASVGTAVTAIALALLKLVALIVFARVVAARVVPRLLGYVAKTRSRELFTLTVLVLALGIAVGSSKFFGASMALGAFLAGLIVGQSDFSARAASDALPMRDAFAVLFFVSVGMLFDPTLFVANLGLALLTLAVVMIVKPLAVFVIVRLRGYPAAIAVAVAAALAQIGEFSFVMAAMGRKLGLVPASATQAIVIASIVSITLSPLLFRAAKPLGRWLDARSLNPADGIPLDADSGAEYRAIVVGYGPVGQTVTRLLRENALRPTVIELNHEVVATIRASGIDAVYGDASHVEVLRQAGAAGAISLIFAASGTVAEGVIRAAKEVNPNIKILARSSYLREIPLAKKAGANVVVAAEAEVALAMTEHLLTELGATAEQFDRERERVRRELVGPQFEPGE